MQWNSRCHTAANPLTGTDRQQLLHNSQSQEQQLEFPPHTVSPDQTPPPVAGGLGPAGLQNTGGVYNSTHISTPSMRRRDLVNVGRSHAHQNLVQNTEFTLGYESIILLYLTGCVYFLDNGDEFSPKCSLNPRLHTIHFIMAVLWPTVFFRLIIYLKYRNANYTSM